VVKGHTLLQPLPQEHLSFLPNWARPQLAVYSTLCYGPQDFPVSSEADVVDLLPNTLDTEAALAPTELNH
jgi:hypothetical protein